MSSCPHTDGDFTPLLRLQPATFSPVPDGVYTLSRVHRCSPALWSHVLLCCCPGNLVMMLDVFGRNISTCNRSNAAHTNTSRMWTWRVRVCVHFSVCTLNVHPADATRTHARTQPQSRRSYRSAGGPSAGPAAALLGVPPVRLPLLGSLSLSSRSPLALLSPPSLLLLSSLLSFFDVTPPRARRHQREHTSRLLGGRRHTSAFLLVWVSK